MDKKELEKKMKEITERNKKTAGKPKPGKSNMVRTGVFWAILAVIFVGLVYMTPSAGETTEKSLSEVLTLVEEEKIDEIIVRGNELIITPREGTELPKMTSRKDPAGTLQDQGFSDVIANGKVNIRIEQPSSFWANFLDAALIIVPVALIIGLFFMMMRQVQGANNSAMGFGRAKAKLYDDKNKKILFTDVAGNEAAKQDLAEIVDFLKKPKKYSVLGAKIPRGVLLAGDPGTGKTLMARAVAGEAGVPFFSISGSEFAEMFVGVGASRVRDLFSKAKKNAPSIIFIDEIDAVAHKRDMRGGSGREDEQTLNQILVEMDGFENETGVIVMAATNRVDMLDKALLRPGRFDRHVNVTLPERKDRLEILQLHFKNKPVEKDVNLEALAAKTPGSSGADLANIANEAAIAAARANRKTIINADITEAFERIAIGPERKSKVMSEEERRLTAYHEAGHAVVGHILPNSDPVHKVTIIPRGRTGGVTWFLSPEDRSYKSIFDLKDELACAMGGRIAEKLILGDDGVTTGAASDLRQINMIARAMVTEEGMGKTLRNQVFVTEENGILGYKNNWSETTSEKIDAEVSSLVGEAAKRAESVLKENRKYLDQLAEELLKKETLEEEEVKKILDGTAVPKDAKLY